jgi:hypothetical protein
MTSPPGSALPFAYVPFGVAAPPASIACDGLVDGAEIHASHWAGNRTPEALKADTSVEIALRLAGQGVPQGARVTNNHFDTDGVLAVFALLHPDLAARYAGLITAAAEAGDFDEWPADERGLRLDMAIRALAACAGGDGAAYERTLPALAGLIAGVDGRRDLWGEEWQRLLDAERRVGEGALEVQRRGGVAAFLHRPGVGELPGPVLSRRQPAGTTRWLLAFEQGDGTWHYRYERPRWAWADTVRRPRLKAPSRNAIAQDLGEGWAIKGSLGMTGILRTARAVRTGPEEVLAVLLRRDPGARAQPGVDRSP